MRIFPNSFVITVFRGFLQPLSGFLFNIKGVVVLSFSFTEKEIGGIICLCSFLCSNMHVCCHFGSFLLPAGWKVLNNSRLMMLEKFLQQTIGSKQQGFLR